MNARATLWHLPHAAELGITHSQCLELLESVEDTIDLFVSGLTYLIHAESLKARRIYT